MSLTITNNLITDRYTKYKLNRSPINSNTDKITFSLNSQIPKKLPLPSSRTYLKQINLNNNISFKNSPVSKYLKSFLNKEVSGYEEQKDKISEVLLEPFIESYRNSSVEVPASVLLFGPEQYVMKNFSYDISALLDSIDNIRIIDFSDVSDDEFMPLLQKGLNEAKKYNEKTGRRSIFYISNPEKIIGMTYNQAKRLVAFKYNEKEINILNSNEKCLEYVPYFKSLLDVCSKPAKLGGNGLTFLFSTQNPHLIHPDFRKGKMEKIEIPRLDNKKAGMSLFYILDDYSNKLINCLKNDPQNKHMIKKIQNLGIEKFDDELGAMIVKFCCASKELGAFSYENLNKIVKNTFNKILIENQEEPEMSILVKEIANMKRAYSFDDVIRQEFITNAVNGKNNLYEQLKDKEELGVLNPEEALLYEEIVNRRRFDKVNLKQKASLNEFEKEYLKQLMADD